MTYTESLLNEQVLWDACMSKLPVYPIGYPMNYITHYNMKHDQMLALIRCELCNLVAEFNEGNLCG